MSGSVNDYIARLEQQLRQRRILDPRILAESRDHLIDAIEEGRERGLSPGDAENEAFERFGAPEIVAAHILEDRGSRKTSIASAFAAFWQPKWWILVPTVLAAAVAAVTSDYFQPARYRAQTMILVVPQRVPENSDRPSVRTRIEDRQRAINQQVRSRERLERIIEDFNLYPERRKKDPMQEIVQDMSKAIDVEMLNGLLFRVAFTTDNPRTAMQVTERLTAYLIDDSLKDGMTLADGASVFLKTQVADTARKLRETEQKIAEYKQQHDGKLPDVELTELTRDYATLRSQYDSLWGKQLEAQTAANLERRQLGEQFRMIDSARVVPRPVGSNRLRAALLGALVGLAAGLLLVVLRRSSNTNTRPPALAQA